ncbi:cytochrome P450 [Penicillium verrucosum]|uniref:cytochrome P450 n=1 Tax=Penicillium verrucosum TaxID=60171 RepID=UPI00254592B0|nr:cytochrome P450 [Penicillium verrucosum]KAJ5920461.1 cytochrome P450 [Penicillium verrucosum]
MTLVDAFNVNTTVAAAILLLAIVPGICLVNIIKHYCDPLRSIPGPFWAKFTRLWYLREMLTGKSRETVVKLHEDYGSVVRIAPNEFSISDMDIMREVYGPRTTFEKSEAYAPFTNPGGVTLVSERNNRAHRELRRKFHFSFSYSQVIKMDSLIDEGLDILSTKFNELADNGKDSDLLHWLKFWSMDNSALLIFGESFGCVENDADNNGLLTLTRASTFYASVVGIIPEWHKTLWNLVPSYILREKEVRNFSEKQIAEKEAAKESTGTACFLDTWFRQKEADRMDNTEVRIGIGGALGGTELTPSFVAQAIFHVYREPAILQRLRDEIDPEMKRSHTADRGIISHEAVQAMPYLQAVLKEVLRLYPIAAITMPRVVPKGGANLAGYHFRAGQVIGVNACAASRKEEYFGRDAGSFRPERWLDDPEEAKRVKYYSLPFSMGGRECIGKHLATLMVLKALALIFYSYDIKTSDKDLKLWNDIVVQVKSLTGRVQPRQL